MDVNADTIKRRDRPKTNTILQLTRLGDLLPYGTVEGALVLNDVATMSSFQRSFNE
jgi:hypothetical protein